MANRFDIQLDSKGIVYTATVQMIQENDMEPAFYRIWIGSDLLEIEPVFDANLDITWRERIAGEGTPGESVLAHLVTKIGRAIERHDVSG